MKYILILVSVFLLGSCTYNEEELPAPSGDAELPIFTGPEITYTNHTRRLFDAYCIACHAPGLTQSNFPLTTYQEVTANNYASMDGIVENRVLVQKNMPPSGSISGFLTVAEKDTLQWWIDQGAPE